MKIQVLSDHIVNQIAAGEVVDRPASVVRELVDNAIDAGASTVSVYLTAGGNSCVRVVDDGEGMIRDDAILAFERHATSKLRSVDDLLGIKSLGFRGEALPSIASVSKVTLRTRVAAHAAGTEVQFNAGTLGAVTAVSAPVGTAMEVRSLFFNTPARRKFLKSPHAEEERVKRWLSQSSLTHPEVHYRLFADDQERLSLPKCANRLERAKNIFGPQGREFFAEAVGATVTGMVLPPSQLGGEVGDLVILVNNRLVSDRIVARAVREGFEGMLRPQEWPVGFVALELEPGLVDVNVHPQKSEVRFRDSRVVFGLVKDAIAAALRELRGPVSASPPAAPQSGFAHKQISAAPSSFNPPFNREFGFQRPASSEISWPSEHQEVGRRAPAGDVGSSTLSLPPSYATSNSAQRSTENGGTENSIPANIDPAIIGTGNFSREVSNHSVYDSGVTRYQSSSEAPPVDTVAPQSAEQFSRLRYIGSFGGVFLLCESTDGIVVVDMHAAHERINFNRILGLLLAPLHEGRAPTIQKFLMPLTIPFSGESLVRLQQEQELLGKVGIELKVDFTKPCVVVTGAAAFFSERSLAPLLRDVAALPDLINASGAVMEKLVSVAARLACHASVRRGDTLTNPEVYALFAELDVALTSAACPHGRPVSVRLTTSQLEKLFGRTE